MEYQPFAVIPAFKTCRSCQTLLNLIHPSFYYFYSGQHTAIYSPEFRYRVTCPNCLLFIIFILASIQQFIVQSSDTGLPAQTAFYAGKKGDSLQPKTWLNIRPHARCKKKKECLIIYIHIYIYIYITCPFYCCSCLIYSSCLRHYLSLSLSWCFWRMWVRPSK